MGSQPPNRLSFLSARWEKLFLLTYDVDPEVLIPHLPPGTALDCIDGRAFVSLVAFDFLQTKVLGIPWPSRKSIFDFMFDTQIQIEEGLSLFENMYPKN